jgi:hypothetical protein
MVLTNLGNDLSGPDLLINKLLPIIDTNNKIDGSPKNDRFLLGDIQVEVERIFIVRIQTKGQLSLLNSFDRIRIRIDLIDTKLKLIRRIS